MNTEEIRIMFCNEINHMIDKNPKNIPWERMCMYSLAMVYINGDYEEFVKTMPFVGKKVQK